MSEETLGESVMSGLRSEGEVEFEAVLVFEFGEVFVSERWSVVFGDGG